MKKVDPPLCLANAFMERELENVDVFEFPEGTRTAADAANAIGCDISDIGKSLVFMTEASRPVLIIINGADQVDLDKVAALLRLSVRKADAAEVREHTGYAIGGVPPFGHAKPVETLIDKKLLAKKSIWLAAGTPKTVFELKTSDLKRVTGIETGVNIAV
ncbi:YbaK/EbsC family protein [Thalassospira tepidiphila]|uniref:Membrane protein n=2 Tax=Thalassospira tepidiphila TaxID=393657 RepID=A0A853KVP9_9PROT|nr:YbaK/EbsC family protein [Thalassospira tepidiphila]NJB76085.1 Cys-tRNA(Pro) deacylase [Thalassospira tepidiphila]OAZ08015.1 membrane protein [Thalassospira tepidiphila MCCC 1A03514]